MRASLAAALPLLLCCAAAAAQPLDAAGDADAPDALALTGLVGAHDPTIAACGGKYYRFSTGSGLPVAVSGDLSSWAPSGSGRVFARNPEWTRTSVPGSTDFWAPDVVTLGGRYRIYYSVSTFGSNVSAIGLASNATLDPASPDYAWIDEGPVIESRRTDPYNCIDPCVAFDAEGRPWLAFGSFWSGIRLARLDAVTGKLADPSATPASIARRPDSVDAIEGAYILPWNGKYYLFASYDFCCKGSLSTYNIRVGRSDSIEGPYVDREGVPMTSGGGSLLRSGGQRYKGPGHNSVLVVGSGCWLVYHAYDAEYGGIPRCRIEPLRWDDKLWPYVTGVGAGDPPRGSSP
jgi:arabinan endo-1,5-alpha-L-arabinosidase